MHTIKVSYIEIEVERKAIKNMHLSVYPPDARVHISMPDYLTDEDAKSFVLQKLEWLRTQVAEESLGKLNGNMFPGKAIIFSVNAIS